MEAIYPQLRELLAGEVMEAKIIEAEKKLAKMTDTLVPLSLAEKMEQQEQLRTAKQRREQGQGGGITSLQSQRKQKTTGVAVLEAESNVLASTLGSASAKRDWMISAKEQKHRMKEAAAKFKRQGGEAKADLVIAEAQQELASLSRDEQRRLSKQKSVRKHEREKKAKEVERVKELARSGAQEGGGQGPQGGRQEDQADEDPASEAREAPVEWEGVPQEE